jgi:hypothetical protein
MFLVETDSALSEFRCGDLGTYCKSVTCHEESCVCVCVEFFHDCEHEDRGVWAQDAVQFYRLLLRSVGHKDGGMGVVLCVFFFNNLTYLPNYLLTYLRT